ncbi:MAG: hypothetical protein HQM09_00245 [Candidatus Riflebacteria bacterium]|nr:hypothetical protein [Candidatus Riflebacteria bacterium]
MKDTVKFLVVVGVMLGIVFVAGRGLLIVPLLNECSEMSASAIRAESDLHSLQQQLDKIPASPNGLDKNMKTSRLRPLRAGSENKAVAMLFEAASTTGALIERCELMPAFLLKAPEENEPEKSAVNADMTLPPLDENGMPINASTDDVTDENHGAHVIPVRLHLHGTYRSLGMFLNELDSKLGLFGTRMMTLSFDTSGIGKGSIELVLPVTKSVPKREETGHAPSYSVSPAPQGEEQ